MQRPAKPSINGFTIVELIVVMVVFIAVLIITATAFKTILTKTRVTFGSEVSNIEGVVGLEMLRHDLLQAGVGLLTDQNHVPDYDEAEDLPHSNYNDGGAKPRVPRPFVAADSVYLGDYLVIKGTTVGNTKTSQKWSYVTNTGIPHKWGANDFEDGTDKLIAVEQYYDKEKMQTFRRLIQKTEDNYAFTYYESGAFLDQEKNPVSDYYKPGGSAKYHLYGIDRVEDVNAVFALRAPFNRTDYFVRRVDADMPISCSPAAGALYKSTMNHRDGYFTDVRVLDCVADMQVVLGWSTDSHPGGGGSEEMVFSNADGSMVSGDPKNLVIGKLMTSPDEDSAKEIQKRLRLIKVYILAQDGGRDLNFTNTNKAMVVGDADLAEEALTNTVDLTADNYKHYRWKLYTIVIRLRNL